MIFVLWENIRNIYKKYIINKKDIYKKDIYKKFVTMRNLSTYIYIRSEASDNFLREINKFPFAFEIP